MVIILNVLLPVLLLSALAAGMWRYNKTKNKWTVIKTGIIMIAVMMIYMLIQPSYLPKGKAPRMQGVTFEQKEVELKDNLSKPKERDINETITVKEEVKNILKEEK
ncbi:hypothetical protein phiA047_0029 [Aeromonas phage phiA047]|nr:hypothetical protein phiA047_0029 [Aeromonas phage phiA047]